MTLTDFPTPKIRHGLDIEAYLKKEGAIAQAVQGGPILVSSELFRLPPGMQALVLAHEAAHAIQLSRPGGDRVRLLEEEAWEAAHHWVAGRSFSVRGRARGRLNAVAFVDPKPHAHAATWYGYGLPEPIGNNSSIKVDRVHTIPGMTLEDVLDRIIEMKGTTEVVIVSHGTLVGLSIPVATGFPAHAIERTIAPLAKDRATEEDGPAGKIKHPAISDKRVTEISFLRGIEDVQRVRAKMNLVRAMKLKHVALRACDAGRMEDTLKAFRDFFGASVSAPREPDSYGTFNPEAYGKDLTKWAAQQKARGYKMYVDGKVAYGIQRDKRNNLRYQFRFKAESKADASAWVKNKIRLDYGGEDEIVYHAMVVDGQTGSPPIYFVRSAEFISRIAYMGGS